MSKPNSRNRRDQAHKAGASVFQILSPEGHTVHTCKSKSDAYRVADRFTVLDGVRHTVRLSTRANVREEQ